MASNAGKRLDRLEKLLDTIATRNKQHHFLVLCDGEDAETKTAALVAQGVILDGDDIEHITVPWTINPLSGTTHIPEGNNTDPLADPLGNNKGNTYEWGMSTGGTGALSMGGIGAPWSGIGSDLLPLLEERWRKHVAAIEASGDRYQGPKATYPNSIA